MMRRHLMILAVAALLCFMAPTLMAAPATLDVSPGASGPISCSQLQNLAFHFAPGDTTPAIRGYEVTIQAGAELSFGIGDITDSGVLAGIGDNFFQVVDNGGGEFAVNGSRFGTDPGILTDADLFKVDLVTSGNGTVDISIVSYRFRDPDNVFIFADMNGMSIVVDCDAPGPVADITAAPGHNKVDVTWTHDGTDTATYEDPQQEPLGIDVVVVNGAIAYHSGTHTRVGSGRALRRGRTDRL